MSSFLPPVYEPDDDAGAAQPGAKLYFFETGTATPLATYSDKELTVPNAHPIIADGTGRFGQVFLLRTQDYTVRLDNAADVTIYTKNDVSAQDSLFTGQDVRISRHHTDPVFFGALGDGVANERTFVQQAIDAAETAGTFVVDLLGLTYRCDTGLVLHDNVKLKNGTLDFTLMTTADCIGATGPAEGSTVAISGGAPNEGDGSFSTTDTSEAVVNDYVLVEDDTLWATSTVQRALLRVRSIVTDASISTHPSMPFDLGSGREWTPIPMMRNIVLEDLIIIGPLHPSGQRQINLTRVDGARIRNVKIEGVNGSGVFVSRCADVVIEKCAFEDSKSAIPQAVSITGNSKNVTVRDSWFSDVGAGVTISSGMDVLVESNKFYGCTEFGVEALEGGLNVDIVDNFIEGDSGAAAKGILANSVFVRIMRNRLMRCQDAAIDYAFRFGEVASTYNFREMCVIKDNYIHACQETNGAVQVSGAAGTAGVLIVIDGNQIIGSVGPGIAAELADGTRHLRISNNTIIESSDQCIRYDGDCQNVIIANNILAHTVGSTVATEIMHLNVGDATSDACIVIGNICRKNEDTVNNIVFNDLTGSGNHVFIGNHINRGDIGIEEAGLVDLILQISNIFTGVVTNNVTGTFGNVTCSGPVDSDGIITVT